MLLAVNHHYVRPSFDAPYPGIHGLTPQQFRERLEQLRTLGEFVSAAQIRDAVLLGKTLPARSLIITFDDGLREQFNWAWPILRELRVPAIFFVNTGPLVNSTVSLVHKIHLLRSQIAPDEFESQLRGHAAQRRISLCEDIDTKLACDQYQYDTPAAARLKFLLNLVLDGHQLDLLISDLFNAHFAGEEASLSRQLYMDRTQLIELQRHGCLGNHGHEHLPLGVLGRSQAVRLACCAAEILRNWTGGAPEAFSYPYGSRTACRGAAVTAAAHAGSVFAFTMERAANPTLDQPLLLARCDTNDMPGGKASRWTADNLFCEVPKRSWHQQLQEVA